MIFIIYALRLRERRQNERFVPEARLHPRVRRHVALLRPRQRERLVRER